jgi:hypothetical protein
MKELDFDELDKAVNSLMANASVSGPKSEPSEKVLEVPTSSPMESALPTPLASPSPVVSAPPAPSRPSIRTPSRPTPSAAPAARRGGRFMDVVHPSSSVKKEVPKPVNREAASIQPTKNVVAPSPVEVPKPTLEEPSAATVAPEALKNDWPDPLEMANFSEPDKKEEPTPEREAMPTVSEPEAPRKDDESPLVSPFLPDTKVEKRPLGGNALPSDSPAAVPAVEDTDDQLPATLEDTKSILPEEFHSDLVAIEADMTDPHKKDEDEDAPVWNSPDVEKPEGEKKPLPPPESKKEDKASIPAGPGSIPQQYKEEKSTGDQVNGAIYDTNAYHQPLSHPAKQKSGWMWVVWIVLILVVGAGGGAALYFWGIIR